MLTWAMLRTGALDAMTRYVASSRPGISWSMSAMIRNSERRTPELMAEVRAAVSSGRGFESFSQWQHDQIQWDHLATDYSSALSGFTPPALIVHGDRDAGVPVAFAKMAAERIPDAELEIIAGAGHWVQRDRPDVVVPVMLDFLERTSTH